MSFSLDVQKLGDILATISSVDFRVWFPEIFSFLRAEGYLVVYLSSGDVWVSEKGPSSPVPHLRDAVEKARAGDSSFVVEILEGSFKVYPLKHAGEFVGVLISNKDVSYLVPLFAMKLYLERIAHSVRSFPEGPMEEGTVLLGRSSAIKKINELIKLLSKVKSTVLITGEPGTGKELVARAIHYNSPWRDKPFVVVNCAAIPPNLLEAELFGYERGAFSGAVRGKPGKFELADGGTLFLDEIGDLPLELQPKLLRVLQFKEVERLGGTSTRKVDVRIVAATNRELVRLMNEGRFRRDLYDRLSTFEIFIPPLRERKEDIPELAMFFLKRYAKEYEKAVKDFSHDVMRKFLEYPWYGNVRELANVVERMVVLSTSPILDSSLLPDRLKSYTAAGLFSEVVRGHLEAMIRSGLSYDEILSRFEKVLLETALDVFGGNILKTSRELKVSRGTIYSRLKRSS